MAETVETYLHEYVAPRVIGRDPLQIDLLAQELTGYLGFRSTGKVETRHSPARGGAAECVLFEDDGIAPMRSDLSLDLYRDLAPVAA